MDYYENLSYRELQQEAKKIGVKSLRVTRQRLLEQIQQIYDQGDQIAREKEEARGKEKEREIQERERAKVTKREIQERERAKEKEREIQERERAKRKEREIQERERAKVTKREIHEREKGKVKEREKRQSSPLPAKRSSESEAILRRERPDLYAFLQNYIDKVPSVRQKEYPWDIILDELNAMNMEDHEFLESLINVREDQIMNLSLSIPPSLFERFPVLLYAILLRRSVQDPWISLIVASSGAYNIYPFSELLKTPLYDDLESLHPFARLVLSSQTGRNLERTTYLCWLEIRRTYDKNTYLVFLRLFLEALLSNDPVPLIELHGEEMSSSDSQKYLPFTEEILNTYLSIYEALRNRDAALIFIHHLERLILSTKRVPQATYLILKFVKTEAFFEYIGALLKNALDYVPMPFGLPHTSIHLVSVTHEILLLERITPTFASVLRDITPHEREQFYLENKFSQQLGRVMADLFIRDEPHSLSSYAESLSILSQYLRLNLSLLLNALFREIIQYSRQKKKLMSFLTSLIENAPTTQGRDIIETIEKQKDLLSSKDRAKLRKVYLKRR